MCYSYAYNTADSYLPGPGAVYCGLNLQTSRSLKQVAIHRHPLDLVLSLHAVAVKHTSHGQGHNVQIKTVFSYIMTQI